jgi:hypothetical protein
LIEKFNPKFDLFWCLLIGCYLAQGTLIPEKLFSTQEFDAFDWLKPIKGG